MLYVHKTGGYCWPTFFKVLGVLFLGEVSLAFWPSKKACWAHQFQYWGLANSISRFLARCRKRTPAITLWMMPLPRMPIMWVNRGSHTSACTVDTRGNA